MQLKDLTKKLRKSICKGAEDQQKYACFVFTRKYILSVEYDAV